ncbi:MAG: protein kinase domain-containing protein [Planctomycetaceae bacterium]
MSNSYKSRSVLLSAEVIQRLMREQGLTAETLAQKTGLSTGAISNLLNENHPVYWSTADVLRKTFDLQRIDLLLKPAASECPAVAAKETIHEWSVEQVLTGWITASNKLQFQVCRLQHQHLRRCARGKRYELRAMSTEEQQRCQSLLTRHAEVCGVIGSHPHVIRNITTCESPQKDAWWVIDEWIDGVSLAETLRETRLSRSSAITLAKQIAEGLHALHQAGIVRRELSPQSILLCRDGSHSVLTEFELAKLLDGSPTVSRDEWPADPYRAPEASSNDVDVRADVYSWGRLVLHLLLGQLPHEGQEVAAIRKGRLPSEMEKLLLKCVSVSRRSRPKGFEEVIAAVRPWKGDS